MSRLKLTDSVLAILVALILPEASAGGASHELYQNVVPANTSDCLDKVRYSVLLF